MPVAPTAVYKFVLVWLYVNPATATIEDYKLIKDYGEDHVRCILAEEKLMRKEMSLGEDKPVIRVPACHADNVSPLSHPGETPKPSGYAGPLGPDKSFGVWISQGPTWGPIYYPLP